MLTARLYATGKKMLHNRSHQRVLAGFVMATAAFATAFVLSNGREAGRKPMPQPVKAVTPVKHNADLHAQALNAGTQVAKLARVPCPPLFGATVAVGSEQEHEQEQEARVHAGMHAVIANKVDVPTLVRLSRQGDASAALVLFQRVRPCSDATRHMDSMEFEVEHSGYLAARGCAQLPAALLRNPINILIPGADAGSTAAKILISKNAPVVASIMKIVGSAPAQEAADLLRLAEKHGLDAAHSGSERAMALLALSYLNGTFGRKDAASAYAIVHAWAHRDSAENRERLAYLQSQMSTAELDSAKSLLNRCGWQKDSDRTSVMRSPFW
ncbi:MAG TPA: hypothetical protein VF800_01455 [Telluria sp.]|jgi:hypothetical protein